MFRIKVLIILTAAMAVTFAIVISIRAIKAQQHKGQLNGLESMIKLWGLEVDEKPLVESEQHWREIKRCGGLLMAELPPVLRQEGWRVVDAHFLSGHYDKAFAFALEDYAEYRSEPMKYRHLLYLACLSKQHEWLSRERIGQSGNSEGEPFAILIGAAEALSTDDWCGTLDLLEWASVEPMIAREDACMNWEWWLLWLRSRALAGQGRFADAVAESKVRSYDVNGLLREKAMLMHYCLELGTYAKRAGDARVLEQCADAAAGWLVAYPRFFRYCRERAEQLSLDADAASGAY